MTKRGSSRKNGTPDSNLIVSNALAQRTNKIQLDETQTQASVAIREPDSVVVVTGMAGSGKTSLAIHTFYGLLKERQVTKLVITRPTVEVGRSMGYLKGDLNEKYEPYLQPVKDFLNRFGNSGDRTYDSLVIEGKVEARPLQFLQGTTFDSNTMVILDECENATEAEVEMLITRMAEGSRLVLTGDIQQLMLKKNEKSGLAKLLRLKDQLPFIQFFELETNHRNPRIKHFLKVWTEDEE